MSWKTVAIKSICKGIYDGPHATPPVSDTGAVFLGISNFSNGQLDLSDIRYISENDLPKWTKRVTPQANDIVFSYEATLNLYAIIPEGFRGCLGRRMALIRVDEKKVYYKFLYYYFYSDKWRAVIQENTVLGATVDRIPLIKFPEFPVEVPPLAIQYRIADILSAYDDLIENNRKQIKLLEEAAQRLYKEWFVDLRFPGHEHTKIVDGVPEGWRYTPLDGLVSYEIGGGWGEDTATGKNECPGFVVRGTDIDGIKIGDLMSIPYRFHTQGNLASRELQDGDIIFEVSGGSKNTGVAKTLLITKALLDVWEKPVMCASFCKLIRFNKTQIVQYIYDCLQYWRAVGETQEYEKKSASSIINYRWKDFLQQKNVLVPEEGVLQKYSIISSALYNQAIICSITISKAIQARDRLLPKLMSGEV